MRNDITIAMMPRMPTTGFKPHKAGSTKMLTSEARGYRVPKLLLCLETETTGSAPAVAYWRRTRSKVTSNATRRRPTISQ
jgi:hypothetical protein